MFFYYCLIYGFNPSTTNHHPLSSSSLENRFTDVLQTITITVEIFRFSEIASFRFTSVVQHKQLSNLVEIARRLVYQKKTNHNGFFS